MNVCGYKYTTNSWLYTWSNYFINILYVFIAILFFNLETNNDNFIPLSCSPVCLSPELSSTFALSLTIRSTGDGGGVFENFDARSE